MNLINFDLFAGIIIDIFGKMISFNYNLDAYNDDKLNVFVKTEGKGNYKLIDEIIFENEEGNDEKKYWVFGWDEGNKKNKSEYSDEDLYGDIIVIAVDNNNNPINVDFEDLEEFCPMSIDDETTDEELGLDEYVYDDFCIDDRELSDEEMGMN